MKSPGTVVLAVALASACCLGTGWISLARAGYIENVSWGFDVYLQQGAIEGNCNLNGAGINGPYGALVRSISLGSPLVRTTQYADHVRFMADDCTYDIMGDADICADIYFTDGLPTKFTVISATGAGTQSAIWRYIYDFKVAGKVIVTRWQTHYGEMMNIRWPRTLITLALQSALPDWKPWRVNTGAPQGSTANLDFIINPDPSWSFDNATVCFGDGANANVAMPLPATVTHCYTLSPGENARTFSVTASAWNPDVTANTGESVTVLRRPDMALGVNGSSVFGGDIVRVEAGQPVLISLADSQGYIEKVSFSISGKLNQDGASLTYSGILFGDSDVGQTYPLRLYVSNTGTGVNYDVMTVNLLVVPGAGTQGLLGLAACCLLRKLRPAG